jgi:hypothetical protein
LNLAVTTHKTLERPAEMPGMGHRESNDGRFPRFREITRSLACGVDGARSCNYQPKAMKNLSIQS